MVHARANVLAKDSEDELPIHAAVRRKDADAVRGLLHHRSKPNPAAALVERYDTVSFSDFSAKLSNFRGLVLFCIEADFCVQIRIFQHFSRSTRLTFLCTG